MTAVLRKRERAPDWRRRVAALLHETGVIHQEFNGELVLVLKDGGVRDTVLAEKGI